MKEYCRDAWVRGLAWYRGLWSRALFGEAFVEIHTARLMIFCVHVLLVCAVALTVLFVGGVS